MRLKHSLLIAALAGAVPAAPAAVAQAQSDRVAMLQPARPAPEPSSFARTAQKGSVFRNGLIGSWAVSAGLSGGVGLYSVSDDSLRPAETRRDPMEVRRKGKRMAAVGVKLSF